MTKKKKQPKEQPEERTLKQKKARAAIIDALYELGVAWGELHAAEAKDKAKSEGKK